MAHSSLGRSVEFKEVKDSTPIYHRQKSCCSSRFITARLAWGAATIGSTLIAPIGFCSGIYRMCTDNVSRGLQTIAYSFTASVKFTLISAVSTLVPQIGASYVRSWVVDTDDLFKHQPKDFFKQLDYADRTHTKYPRNLFTFKSLEINTNKGRLDAAEISPMVEYKQPEKIVISFNGAGNSYQLLAPYLVADALELGHTAVVVNYPGVTMQDYQMTYKGDLFNVGIAVVDDIVKRRGLTNDQAANQIILAGYSLGGCVAVSSAAYYKKHHGIDFPIFINRSPWKITESIAACFYKPYLGLPLCFSTRLQQLYYWGGGGWNIDSENAYKLLDPSKLDYIYVDRDAMVPKGCGFADAVSQHPEVYYYQWNGQGDPEIRIKEWQAHSAPNHTLFRPENRQSARDRFHSFICNATKQNDHRIASSRPL